MANHLIDLTGRRFGRLTVIKRVENNSYGSMWLCVCDCGETTVKSGYCLRQGHTTSCGCYAKEVSSRIHQTHGESKKRLFHRWMVIKNRCKENDEYHKKRYFDRGITVCDEWINDYSAFKDWALKNGYSDELTLDRIDFNKGYSPDNCRWIPEREQHLNTSKNKIVEYNGEKMPLIVLCDKTGIRENILRDRLRRGWTVERAVSTQLGKNGRTKHESIYRD